MKGLRFSTALIPYVLAAHRYTTRSQHSVRLCAAVPALSIARQSTASLSNQTAHTTTPTTRKPSADTKQDENAAAVEEVQGLSGRRYIIEKILQDKHMPLGRVYLARSDSHAKYVVKEIPQDFKTREGIYDRVRHCPNIRMPIDRVPERRMFNFHFLDTNLLQFAQREVPLAQIKTILKQVLQGLAALHEQRVVHNDIKPNNIFFNAEHSTEGSHVNSVLLSDLEDADYLGPDRAWKGRRFGNWMWRSPESHAEGPVKNHSDIFSFGIVCIYAVTKKVIFDVDKSTLDEGIEVLSVVLERQLSYFGTEDGLQGFFDYLREDHPYREIFQFIENGFVDGEQPREPFALWKGEGLDDEFKDLILGLAVLDPEERLTAQQALEHKWFKDA